MPNSLAGFPSMGRRIDTQVVYHPRVITYNPAVAIGTDYPGTPQVEIEIQAGDLPTYANGSLPHDSGAAFNEKYTVFVIIGLTGGGSTRDITIQSLTNATPTWTTVVSLKTLSAGYYGTCITTRGLTGEDVGSTRKYQIKASGAGCTLTWTAIIVVPTCLLKGEVAGLSDLQIELSADSLIPGGYVASTTSAGWSLRSAAASAEVASLTSSISLAGWVPNLLYGIGLSAVQAGEWRQSSTQTRPHWQFYYPTRVAYTPILL